jgi:CheY-like chemotaxis protein
MNAANVHEILLVEDSPEDIELTKEAIKENPFKVNLTVVTDGDEALEYIKREGQYKHVAVPDLILLDLNLPGKSGIDILSRIKANPESRQIPVVIFTTSQSQRDIVRAYDAFANCYVVKPLGLKEFIDTIGSIEKFWLRVAQLP